jgi:exosortase C (VPDSG-CTERM-specific)
MKLEIDKENSTTVPSVSPAPRAATPEAGLVPSRRQFTKLTVLAVVLLLVYAWPLLKLATFAYHADLYSHILLIPFVSGYLIWIKRTELRIESRPSPGLAALSAAAGVLVLACYWLAVRSGWSLEPPDYLAATTLSLLLFLVAAGFIFLGAKYLRNIAFPIAFLFFSVPFPMVVREVIETFFQHGSAEVAYAMLKVSGMPVLRVGTFFQLPGVPLEVARECSGIHSSVVLIITSLLATYLFLQKASSRWILMLAVVPLGLLRNGFRIFVISQLCVRYGPQMIDSPIHRKGGPIFFLLSLIPLFLLLKYLINREMREKQTNATIPKE